MHKPNDYRRHAVECMNLMKQQMDQQEHRKMLEEMAQIWLKLAAERERHIDHGPQAA